MTLIVGHYTPLLWRVQQRSPLFCRVEQHSPLLRRVDQHFSLLQQVKQHSSLLRHVEQQSSLVRRVKRHSPKLRRVEQRSIILESISSTLLCSNRWKPPVRHFFFSNTLYCLLLHINYLEHHQTAMHFFKRNPPLNFASSKIYVDDSLNVLLSWKLPSTYTRIHLFR